MRPSYLLAVALLAATPVASFAQYAPKPAAKPAPAASAEAQPTIKGVPFTRPDGRFIGVEAEGVSLKITFYNKEKKKEKADVARITARWSDSKPRFAVLLSSGAPEVLVSPPALKRPFNYSIYLALVGADDQVKESYTVRLPNPPAE